MDLLVPNVTVVSPWTGLCACIEMSSPVGHKQMQYGWPMTTEKTEKQLLCCSQLLGRISGGVFILVSGLLLWINKDALNCPGPGPKSS
jgi:hypothetical protein